MSKGKSGTESGQLSLVVSREDRLRFMREHIQDCMRSQMMQTVYDIFQEELDVICGKSWSRKGKSKARRGGSEKGSIFLDGRRIPVSYPRVVTEAGSQAIDAYRSLRDFDLFSEEIQSAMIHGMATRDYSKVIGRVKEGTGLSHTTVSRGFIKASQKKLDELQGRDLSGEQYIGLFVDGLAFKEVLLIVAMGVTVDGRKRILGLEEGYTENADAVGRLFDNLIDRGLCLTERFLAVLDGSKALKAAVLRRFGNRAEIQRCQVHKKRNVKDKLPKKYHADFVRRVNVAYGMKDYDEALQVLRKTQEWLGQISEPAAASLAEGMEETLTVIRLGLPDALRKTFATTNPIESAFDGVRQRTGRVKNWKPQMVSRWSATALLEIETRLRRIRGYKQMAVLNAALNKRDVDVKEKTA